MGALVISSRSWDNKGYEMQDLLKERELKDLKDALHNCAQHASDPSGEKQKIFDLCFHKMERVWCCCLGKRKVHFGDFVFLSRAQGCVEMEAPSRMVSTAATRYISAFERVVTIGSSLSVDRLLIALDELKAAQKEFAFVLDNELYNESFKKRLLKSLSLVEN